MNTVKIEFYDRKGDLLKISVMEDFRKLDRWWFAHKITADNVQTKKKSILSWSKREIGIEHEEDAFASDALDESF